jgi:hypothetical protein
MFTDSRRKSGVPKQFTTFLEHLVEHEGFELMYDSDDMTLGRNADLNLRFRDLKRGTFQWAFEHDFDRWANSVDEETGTPKTFNGARKLVGRLTVMAHHARNSK